MKTKGSIAVQDRWSRRCFLQLLLVPTAAALACASCKRHDQNGSEAVNPAGTYALVSVDGHSVPCTVKHEGHSLAVHGGVFTINADNTCVSKMEFTAPNGVKGTREVKATYTQKGNDLTMKWEGAGMTKGAVSGNTFSMNNEGMVLTYRK